MKDKCYTLRDFLEVFYKVQEYEDSNDSNSLKLIPVYDALYFLENIVESRMCSTEGHDFYMMGNVICELRDRCKKIIKNLNEQKEEQYLKTYVQHEESGKWFFVSSINKITSAGRGSETMVWEWDNQNSSRTGRSIGTYYGSYNSSVNHMTCVNSLLQDGELDDEEECEDD